MRFPGGAKFAFTVFDDTDVSTVANVAPVYDLLDELGFRTTKSVWMLRGDTEGSNFARSETMQDKHYREFVLDLHKRGFEIAFHGAAMESSRREDVMAALKSFAQEFGSPPNAHANHAENRDNLYWGGERFSSLPLRMLAWMISKLRSDNDPAFSGNHPDSPYFWGDLCQQQVKYVRNFCLDNINLLNVNPSMPYHNPRKPYVNYWFSALDAPNVTSFNHLLTQSAVDRLEEQGGVCIVATHFGKFFVRDGVVDPSTQSILEYISGKNGWYVPVSELLDYMQSQAQGNGLLSATELLLLELRWLIYRLRASGRDERPDWVVRD
ncbi:hypothetical protein [Candidatus Thiodiazotropha sp. CDECU1]|uniref:hypothetical protein n=1 Tax=Candidatus Thiodiazotropha sp. CDECU1 TaxID=3065865 RepID=UPI00292FB7C4|nr:hypothetical protein [Candidatus Thiodiazotropha sp. CDECU1]